MVDCMEFLITIRFDDNVLTAQRCVANTLHAAKKIATRLCLEQQHLHRDLRGGYQSNWQDIADHAARKVWYYQELLCQIDIQGGPHGNNL